MARTCRAKQSEPFNRRGWLFELKLGGVRALAYIEVGGCPLMAVYGYAIAGYEALAQAMPAAIGAGYAILEGEIVVLDAGGEPGADDLGAGQGRVVFAAFDLLWLDGEDFQGLPLSQRRALIERHPVVPFTHVVFLEADALYPG